MELETIATERLWLKRISSQEMDFIFKNYAQAEIMRLLGHRSETEFGQEAYKHRNGYASYNRQFRLFLMVDKATDYIIGRCGIHNWNPANRRGEIGYSIEDDRYKQKGLMTEAVKAVIDYGFNQMELNRLEAVVNVNNVPSLKIIAHYPFVQEAVLHQYFYKDGQFEDAVLFVQLHRTYLQSKKG